MDTETVSPNFDDIRPLNNSEVKDAIEKLVANEDFERALRYIKPNLNWEEFSVEQIISRLLSGHVLLSFGQRYLR